LDGIASAHAEQPVIGCHGCTVRQGPQQAVIAAHTTHSTDAMMQRLLINLTHPIFTGQLLCVKHWTFSEAQQETGCKLPTTE